VFSAEEYAAIVAVTERDEGRGTAGREAMLVVKGTDEIMRGWDLVMIGRK